MLLPFGLVALLLGHLGLALLAGTEGPPSLGSSSHSLCYFYTGVSEPNQGLPQFIAVGYVDGQPFVQYDSNTRRAQPLVPWMKKVDEEHRKYWERTTQMFRNSEQTFRENLEILRSRYNQSRGFHSLQEMLGCRLRLDRSQEGYEQFAYDGRDYISFDKETLTWTAADLPALNTKMKWEKEPAIAQRQKAYLEEECTVWLQRYLEYGKETLLRTERPVGKVTRKAGFDGTESLVCQAYGFYPKEIEVTWRKDGEVLHEDTFHRNTAPHPDGTYHAWLSIKVDPKDRDQYRCHVEHASLREPLVLAWEEPASNWGLIVGCVVVALLLIAAVSAGSCIYYKKRQVGYKADSRFHSVQRMYSCEMRPDGSKGGHEQFAYDGRDYISFDKETLTWTAADPPALNTRRKWEKEPALAQREKAYLEEICMEWLQRYVGYGKETLLRTASDGGSNSSSKGSNPTV